MRTDVPTITPEIHAELVNLVLAMHADYGNGLREFQEAIHYSIFHMNVCSCKNVEKNVAIENITYLRELAVRLHALENLVNRSH